MPPTENKKKNLVDHSTLNVLGDDTSTHKVQAKVVVPSTSGLAKSGSMHSLSGSVCHSIDDQFLGTSVEEINPFFQLDVDTMTVKTMREELIRLKVELSSSYKKDQLKELIKDAYMKDLRAIASSHYRKYMGAVYDIKISKPTHIVFRCTKYKAGENGSWTNSKACRKIIQNNDSLSGTKPIMCPGTMIVSFNDGKVSLPKFPQPFHLCGCLTQLRNMDLGHEDYRPTLEMIGPNILSSDLMRSETRQGIIDFIDAHVSWQGLNGGKFAGKVLRKFVLDLTHNKHAHSVVEKIMKPYIQHVQSVYPCLVTVKYGAIKSFAGCPSQFEGHDNRFHTDYSSFYPELPPHERPVSIILALDDFEFIYLPHSTLPRKDIVSIKVPPGHAIFFTNACLHSGGPNFSQNNKIRLFAYMVSNRVHLPMNQVFNYEWSNDDNKDLEAVIQFPQDTVGKTEYDGNEGNADDYKYNEDSSDFSQGEGSKRKKGKTKSM